MKNSLLLARRRTILRYSMKEVSSDNFGILIAFLVPGFTALWGVSFHTETVRVWLTGAFFEGPTVGGFLYVTLAAIAAGLTVSTVRWAILDRLHHCTGIRRSVWDYTRLERHVTAHRIVEENHYKFYQFYGGMLFAVAFTWLSWRIAIGFTTQPSVIDFATCFLLVIFFAGSRDTLRKYYDRTTQLLSDGHQEFKPSFGAKEPRSPLMPTAIKASDQPFSRQTPVETARHSVAKNFVATSEAHFRERK